MSEKRKDHRGRILRTGEGQRANLTYFYRYHMKRSTKWYYVYAHTLDELRRKEEQIQRDLLEWLTLRRRNHCNSLAERYLNLRRGLKENSKRAYAATLNRIRESSLGQRKIRNVKLSDAKTWFVALHDEGLKQNTIGVIQSSPPPSIRDGSR